MTEIVGIQLNELRKGQKYWLRYRIPGVHRADRTMIGLYLDRKEDQLDFSGRPQYGTTSIKTSWISIIREVVNHAECHIDRRA